MDRQDKILVMLEQQSEQLGVIAEGVESLQGLPAKVQWKPRSRTLCRCEECDFFFVSVVGFSICKSS